MKKLALAAFCAAVVGWGGIAAATPSLNEGTFFSRYNDYIDFNSRNKTFSWDFNMNSGSLFTSSLKAGLGGSTGINAEDMMTSSDLVVWFDNSGSRKKPSSLQSTAGSSADSTATLINDQTLTVTIEGDGASFGSGHIGGGSVYGGGTGTAGGGITAGGAAPVPEPTTMLLFGTGLLGLAAAGRKKIRRA